MKMSLMRTYHRCVSVFLVWEERWRGREREREREREQGGGNSGMDTPRIYRHVSYTHTGVKVDFTRGWE